MESINREAMMRLVKSKPPEMSVREFCKVNNIRESQYFYWRNKINNAGRPVEGKGFTPLKVKNTAGPKNEVLASLNLPGGTVLIIYDPSIIPPLGQMMGL